MSGYSCGIEEYYDKAREIAKIDKPYVFSPLDDMTPIEAAYIGSILIRGQQAGDISKHTYDQYGNYNGQNIARHWKHRDD